MKITPFVNLRRFIAPALAATLMLLPFAARADLGDRGDFTVSVDRLFGFNNTRTTRTVGNVDASDSNNYFSLLIPSTVTAYSSPRLALDYGVADRVTLGGAIGFIFGSSSGTRTVGNLSTETNGASGSGLLIAPRAGFVASFDKTKLWLRGGLSYFRTSSSSDTANLETSTNGFSLNLEPTVAFMLAPHAGLTVGAVIDLPLSGETNASSGNTTQSTDAKVRNIGVVVGVAIPL
jgi:hypothetical protein